jgi:hypothetical protein
MAYGLTLRLAYYLSKSRAFNRAFKGVNREAMK